MPRHCQPFDLGNGVTGIACGSKRATKRCCECGDPSSRLCDYPLRGKKSGKTCDRPLCARCAVPQGKLLDGDTKDYCLAHAALER